MVAPHRPFGCTHPASSEHPPFGETWRATKDGSPSGAGAREGDGALRPRLTWLYVGGMAVLHFAGAGLFGFAHTLPQVNYYTHGAR